MPVERYNRVAQAFHWVIAILVIINLALGLLHDPLEDVVQLIPTHRAIGLTVLVLTLGRIAWRFTWKKPPLARPVGSFARALSSTVHFLFYVLSLALPLTGWIFTSPGRTPTSWFGLFDFPQLPVGKDDPIAGLAHTGHEVLGLLMLALAVLHIAAALRHQFILKDRLIQRMI
jgi:cytochrome b561